MNIPELLCPAGSFESFKAAVNNGADAVYFGGRDFNARASAENFTDEQLVEAIDYAHLRGAQVNITINTQYKDRELERVLSFAEKMYTNGADAFIIQDIGFFSAIKKAMPDIRLLASTQMTVHSLEGAIFLKEQGFDRAVISRELSLAEIREIVNNSGMEIEVFAHGALCVSYSGQCLMSSFIGGRSGNRGRCAGSCRQFYTLMNGSKKHVEGYLLSPRDLMSLDRLHEITETGVHTLKLEGRMKSPEYVAVITRAYREQLDRIKAGLTETSPEAVKDVTQIFNRGGAFTKGYFYDFAGTDMMSNMTPKSTGTYLGKIISVSKNAERDGKRKCLIKIESAVTSGDGVEIWTETGENTGGYVNEKAQAGAIITVYAGGDAAVGNDVYKSYDKELNDRAAKMAAEDRKTIEINCNISMNADSPAIIKLERDGIEITVSGDAAQMAQNNPMPKDRILEQLCKTGNTSFTLNFNQTDIGEDIYMPISSVNKLRREALELFAQEYAEGFRRELFTSFESDKKEIAQDRGSYSLRVQVANEAQLKAACEEGIDRVYYTISGYGPEQVLNIIEKYAGKTEIYIALPKIMRQSDERAAKELFLALEATEIKGYLISTYGQLALAKKFSEKEIITDYSFNVFNNKAYDYVNGYEVHGITLSTEASMEEMKAFPAGEAVVYGNIPLMITHQCPVGLYGAGKVSGKYCKLKNNSKGFTLVDKTGANFPVYTDCESCYALILNGPKLNLQEKLNIFNGTNVKNLRLLFYTEDFGEVRKVIRSFKEALIGHFHPPEGDVTFGHYFREVK